MNRKQTLISLFSAAALLSACGGGGDDPAPPPPAATDAVPDSASASASGLAGYLTDLSTMPVESKEPVDLSSFLPKSAEDSEPETIS
ncbi:MAG TPA: hypothetical protein VGP22_09180 [Albitalea sp.]|jgi:hypothetical protein|nr:hypothetical protein [Albitalea sp.]